MYLNNNIEAHRYRGAHTKKGSSAWAEGWADNSCLKPTRPSFYVAIYFAVGKNQLFSLVKITTETKENVNFTTATMYIFRLNGARNECKRLCH